MVDVTSPPTITVSNGFYTSLPVPIAINNSINPSDVFIAVMKAGMSRSFAPWIDADRAKENPLQLRRGYSYCGRERT